MAYKISDSFVACGTCIGECPVEAISAGDIYVIDPSKCIDCGTRRYMYHMQRKNLKFCKPYYLVF